MPEIPAPLTTALATRDDAAILAAAIAHFGAQAGTVHRVREGVLRLTASHAIPAPLLPVIDAVPIGKGIAGLAAERREPVSLCNLQTDTSGAARPAAKTTGMEGSIAVPMLAGEEVRGVFGVAKATAYEWSAEEKALLLAIAAEMA